MKSLRCTKDPAVAPLPHVQPQLPTPGGPLVAASVPPHPHPPAILGKPLISLLQRRGLVAFHIVRGYLFIKASSSFLEKV